VRVLVVNAGSSSLRVRLLDGDALLAARDLAPAGDLAAALRALPAPDAVGHRVVHGGERFTGPALMGDEALAAIEALVPLAPLHLPAALEGIAAARAALPGVPVVACFDTTFHATLPPEAATYALPAAWRERWPLRRFGFHGLSHAHAARRAAALTGREDLRVVSCHLGAGASLAAVRAGRSVDTTMGFTPLEGLVMATRAGSVDPGLVLWLAERLGLEEVERGLTREAGLLGLAGTADLREVLARDDDAAALAVAVLVHRLRGSIAAMAAALGGLDALVFTGGAGEASAPLRARATEGLGFLGVALDESANAAARGDAEVGAPGGAVRVLVVQAREDLEIARQVRGLLQR
jgi:acetate kinase